MNNNASLNDSTSCAELDCSSAPFVAPAAPMLPGSASLDEFGIFEDYQYWAVDQPEVDKADELDAVEAVDEADEINEINGQDYIHFPEDVLQPLDDEQIALMQHDWFMPGNSVYLGPGYQQLPETDVALGTNNGFVDAVAYPLVEVNTFRVAESSTPASYPTSDSYDTPVPHYTPASPYTQAPLHTPAPGSTPPPASGNTVDAQEAVDSVDALEAMENSLIAKERQARAVIKDQQNQHSAVKQMGESVTIVHTTTGVKFGGVYWTPPANDQTIPVSEADITACIDALAKAMRNIEGCREKTTTGQYRNRWSPQSIYYTEDQIKGAAGELMMAMIQIHQNGWTKTIYDKGERENCQMTMFYTFEDRFETLRELLQCSKTTCQDILKSNRFHAIIGNPRVLILRTATNKSANVHKSKLIKAGMRALKPEDADQTSNGEKDIDSEEDPNAEEQPADEVQSNSKGSTNAETSSRPKKRAYAEVFITEEPGIQQPRKKAAVKKPRKA